MKIRDEERVLLFVQFEDLMKKVSEALEFRGIPHLQITGSATKKSNTLERFQNNQHARVLLLNVIDESASGAYSPPLPTQPSSFPQPSVSGTNDSFQESHKCQSRHFSIPTSCRVETSVRCTRNPSYRTYQTVRTGETRPHI